MATRPRSIDDLSNEIISIIIYQLVDPGPLSMTSRRLYQISKDPYVRSSYFLARYGRQQAFYWALARGKLVNNRVLDILFTSGAHLSRYLLQTAIHHYFRTTAHFIKHQWARTLPLPVFTHFMSLHRYGCDVPLAKGEDDGSIFLNWLKEKINPGQGKKIDLDIIRGLFVKYGFMVFAPKDPIAGQLPLAFALEPTLLPLAVANGFHMDSKYRDFIFRKMFEKSPRGGRVSEIVRNVQEMTSLDRRMFLSRTVAAEVCMECRVNDAGYIALKRLDADGALLFCLKDLVNDLLQLFLKTRSITHQNTVHTLQTLFRDFSPDYPSPGPRLVMLITVFRSVSAGNCIFNDSDTPTPNKSIRERLESLGLLPLTRSDLVDVLTSAWCEKPRPVFAWAEDEMGLTNEQLRTLAEEVAVKSLTTSCKGKFLRRLVERFSSVRGHISAAMKEYRFDLDSLPDYWANEDCGRFRTGLNTSLGFSDIYSSWINRGEFLDGESNDDSVESEDEEREQQFTVEEDGKISKGDLGNITQDTLSNRIQLDTENSLRIRRRYWHSSRFLITTDTQLKLPFPADALHIGKWVLSEYGPRDPVVAVFMTHAIVNGNMGVFQQYLEDDVPRPDHVPVTLKHFRILAKLGREPYWQMWGEIEHSEFFFSEDDYLEPGHRLHETATYRASPKTKLEDKTPEFESKVPSQSIVSTIEHSTLRKRPRRSTAVAPSYVIPDSDDDAIAEENATLDYQNNHRRSKGKGKAESNLQTWIKHLTALLKEEEKKYKEKKKTIEKNENGKPKHRLPKSDFMKSVATRLRDLRASERQNRRDDATLFRRNGRLTDSDCDSVGSDDEEYVLRQPRPRKRRIEVSREEKTC